MSVRHTDYRYVGKATAVTVDERQRSLNPVTLTTMAHRSNNELDEPCPVTPTFNEDFLLEHSRVGKQANPSGFVSYF